MAPKSKAPPLCECVIALSGTFPGFSQPQLEQEYLIPLGAKLSKTVTQSITHLVTTETDFAKPSTKVKQAQSHDLPIVTLSWLEDCIKEDKRLDEDAYTFASSSPALAPASTNASLPPRKRTVIPVDDSDDDQTQKPAKRSKSVGTNGPTSQSQPAPMPIQSKGKQHSVDIPESRIKSASVEGPTNVAKSSVVNIPMDEHCTLADYVVYIDDDGIIYDASLNQTNSGHNNNKFYMMQVLRDAQGDCRTWTRWGRVGDRGQNKTLGNGSLNDAIRQFESKFKDKSGLSWADRGAQPKPNKYTFIERSYGDSDDEETSPTQASTSGKVALRAPESKLHPAIQDLMKLIFNQQFFAATMTELNYDVAKLPLGKLSKSVITRGYQTLKDLSVLLHDPSLAQSEHGTSFQDAAEQLSNTFFSLIPHDFGRDRPPVITNVDLLKREIDLLDNLSDMKDASNIMKIDTKGLESINALDQQFKGLNLSEMAPLDQAGPEYTELAEYLVKTRGATHGVNYDIQQIFRIERQSEQDRFKSGPLAGPSRDRRLLWHGSRSTNFGGILSQGLRIAPPEAPVSGYMFGKGIYLADMSSKSANYCVPQISNGHALLLLCEAELGDPMLTLIDASYTAPEDALARGMLTTWGQGKTGPKLWKDADCVHPSLKGVKIPDTRALPGPTGIPGAWLQYNEYITYNVEQVRLRYLFRVKMF